MSEGKKGKSSDLTEAAKKLGAAGGAKGGPARAQALTAEERSKIASAGGKAHAAKLKGKIKARKKRKPE